MERLQFLSGAARAGPPSKIQRCCCRSKIFYWRKWYCFRQSQARPYSKGWLGASAKCYCHPEPCLPLRDTLEKTMDNGPYWQLMGGNKWKKASLLCFGEADMETADKGQYLMALQMVKILIVLACHRKWKHLLCMVSIWKKKKRVIFTAVNSQWWMRWIMYDAHRLSQWVEPPEAGNIFVLPLYTVWDYFLLNGGSRT